MGGVVVVIVDIGNIGNGGLFDFVMGWWLYGMMVLVDIDVNEGGRCYCFVGFCFCLVIFYEM